MSIPGASRKSALKIKKSLTTHGSLSASPPEREHKPSPPKKKKARRDSVLRPSVYQKIQKRRKSQLLAHASKSLHIAHAPRRTRTERCSREPVVPSSAAATPKKTPTLRLSLSQHYARATSNRSSGGGAKRVGRGRTVFICVRGLFECWRSVAPSVLFDALLILPLCAEWLRCPSALREGHCFRDVLSDAPFVTLLRWKDEQGLLFLMLNDATPRWEQRLKAQHALQSHAVAPFWLRLSAALQRLTDPASPTKDAYRALRTDARWWRSAFSFHSRFGVTARDVLDELHFLTLKFRAIQELLFQSNPSLEVVLSLSSNPPSPVGPRPSILATAHTSAVLSIGSIGSPSASPCHPRPDRPRLSMMAFDGDLEKDDLSGDLELALNDRAHEQSEDSPRVPSSVSSLATDSASRSRSQSPELLAMANNDSGGSAHSQRSHTDCAMDWWLCPDYYYDTFAAKVDSDEADTE